MSIHSSLAIIVIALGVTPCIPAHGSESIRIWGSARMQDVVQRWQEGFKKAHPSVRLEPKLLGTETGMAGLYTGVADIAVMGRPATPKEIMAFEWVFKYKPLEIAIMTGSLNVSGKSPALVVFVHHDNPLSRLTLAQVDAIFGCEHLRGSAAIENWGQIGLTGNWAHKTIHAYGIDTETASAAFFRTVVMKGSTKWNWPHLREFKSAKEVLEALAQDPAGIAVANLCFANAGVKPVALNRDRDSRYYAPAAENLMAQSYPLTRLAYAYINRPPGKSIPAPIRQFLQYVLSSDGQQAIKSGYLRLNAGCLQRQRSAIR